MPEVFVSSSGGLKQQIAAGNHTLIADEPVEAGGTNEGPDPYSLLLAALGSCTSMTLQLYAKQKGIPLEHVEIRLSHSRIHVADCLECGPTGGYVSTIKRRISLFGPLTDQQRSRLMEIAKRCPVHKTLLSPTAIEDSLDEATPFAPV